MRTVEKPMVRYSGAEGRSGRVVVVRLRPGSDFIEGIKQACRDYKIRNGYIGSCIGGLRQSRFLYGVPDKSTKSGTGYSPEVQFGEPTEFIGGQGTVCHNEKGEVLIHFHGFLCDKGHIYGGHFDKPGSVVSTTMEIVIHEVEGVELTRPFDGEVDQNHLHPEKV